MTLCPAHHPNLPHANGACTLKIYHYAPHVAENGNAFRLPGECETCATPLKPVESYGGEVIALQCPRCLQVYVPENGGYIPQRLQTVRR